MVRVAVLSLLLVGDSLKDGELECVKSRDDEVLAVSERDNDAEDDCDISDE
jgi:hypothetical protein